MSTRQPTTSSRVRRFVAGLLHGGRAAVLDAAAVEYARAERECAVENEKDFFDRLPDPPPHLENGDIKYFDGKFRYF